MQLAVNVGHQILQGLVDFGLGVPTPELDALTVHIEGRPLDGRFQRPRRFGLQLFRLIHLGPDDVLHGSGELGHIALLDILAYLHGALQRSVIGGVRQHDEGAAGGARQHFQLRLVRNVQGGGQKPELHPAGKGAGGIAVHHAVKGEVIFPIAEFWGAVDVAKNNVGDALDDGGGIHVGAVCNLPLHVLLLVGEEVVGLPASGDVILPQQPVQGGLYPLPEDDLVHPDVVSHQDDDIVQISLDIVYVAHQIQ